MELNEYINRYYPNDLNWFVSEVKKSEHLTRVSNVLSNKNYLNGQHKILQRKDIKWKNEEYKVTKLVLQEGKTIINFHDTFLLGKPVSITGSENKVKIYNGVFRKGGYNKINFNVLDKVNKYGDCFEYVYIKNGIITSKIIDSANGYPIYSDDNEYIGFVEYIKTNSFENSSNTEYYNVYSENTVQKWNNTKGELQKVDEVINVTGLPIHWHNINDKYINYGISFLSDIIPIIDLIEDLLSKMNDAVYCMSLNPIAVIVGQQNDYVVDADGVGYSVNLDAGDFKFSNANLDYSSIKLLLDTLHKKLETISCIPGVCLGESNISNVSEVSLSMLYNLSYVKALLDEVWLKEGLQERINKVDKLLELQGIVFEYDDYIDFEFNYSKPINTQELLQNIKTQWEMGAISLQSIIEKSNLVNDVTQEMERIKKDKQESEIDSVSNGDNSEVENKNDVVGK